jgi:hypothetical protein
MQAAIPEIEQYLERLRNRANCRMVASCPRGWFVLHSYSPPVRALLEAATSRYLAEDMGPSEKGETQLRTSGFKPRRGGRSLGKMVGLAQPGLRRELAEEIAFLLEEVYLCQPSELQLSLDAPTGFGLKNPGLLEAMQMLSKQRSHECRIAVYQRLLNATLLLPLQDGEPKVVGTLGKFNCYGAFTDYRSVRLWDPRGCSLRELYSIDLFPMLQSLGAGSLLINPDGDVGGELYRNEIDTMAKAATRNR